MTLRKRAAALGLAAALCLSLLAGCGGSEEGTSLSLTACLGQAPVTLDPIRATEERDMTVLTHLYENLLKPGLDSEGNPTITNGMAKSYDVDQNNDGTFTYTFHLRKARWSDGETVTADDFVYAWRRLADPVSQAPNAELLSPLKGFDEVRSTGDVTKLGIEAKNDSTLLVTLMGACEWFLTDVCTSTATVPLREDVVQSLKSAALELNEKVTAAGGTPTATWSSDHAALVTNGPYVVGESGEESMVLRANEEYNGSLVDGPTDITFRYTETQEEAWTLYQSGQVDFVAPLPEEAMTTLAEADENWTALPELNTRTLLFNTSGTFFSDPMARQAFALTLDRAALSQQAGLWTWPAEGLVPYGVPDVADHDFRTHGGVLVNCDPTLYADNCTAALEILETAGYDGKHFPQLTCIYPENAGLRDTVAAMAAMWAQQLKITVTPCGMPEEEVNAALAAGEYDLAVVDISGAYNDAESFLTPWMSGSWRNVVDYANSAFDTLLTVIAKANDDTARRGCLHDAESLLLEDCPLTPLYFTGSAYALRQGLTGLCRDARGFYSFASVTVPPAQ